ncbi:MauE/DoxX family redox-associated membrane protein [Corallococcus sp. AB011P]|uniref:MauE/DoxX family redox-associated membrane protein n=1 Tax=Corallococcus sp. AB011P TaxID=2316735 RepID=UPI00210384A3|nr:MauE/DoxX family redox-associated membrane protein [Corallococcus sp. AB011P]
MSAVNLGCRLMLSLVFVLAAISKARGRKPFEDFIQTLVNFGLPPSLAGAPLAATLILAEAASALLLLLNVAAGYALALALLGGFTLGIAWVLRRGAKVACRCFGASNTPVGAAHLVRNGLLLAVTVAGAVSHAAASGAPVTVAMGAIAGTAGVLGGVFVTRWDDLVFLIRGPEPVAASSRARRN